MVVLTNLFSSAAPKTKHSSKTHGDAIGTSQDHQDTMDEVATQSVAAANSTLKKNIEGAVANSMIAPLGEGQSAPESLNKKALTVVNRVRDKLTGRDFDPNVTLDVPEQVDLLIKQATSHENLCQCYIGWCPFW